MSGEGEMTLVFTLPALTRLDDPAAAVTDAHRWSQHVGVIASDPDDVTQMLDREAIEVDFVSGDRGEAGTIAAIRQRFRTDRHVFLGTNDEHRDTATALGWEYLNVDDAAEKAEWGLVN